MRWLQVFAVGQRGIVSGVRFEHRGTGERHTSVADGVAGACVLSEERRDAIGISVYISGNN